MSIVRTNGGGYGGAKNWHLTTYICWSEVTPTDYFVGTSFIVVDATRSSCSLILLQTSQLLLKFLSTPLHELYVHMNENIAQYSSIHSLSVSHIFKSVDDLTDRRTNRNRRTEQRMNEKNLKIWPMQQVWQSEDATEWGKSEGRVREEFGYRDAPLKAPQYVIFIEHCSI